MVNPVPVSYSAPSTPMAAGRFLTPQIPTWASTLTLFDWHAVPNTTFDQLPGGMDARNIFAYSGGALKASGSEMFLVGGGHADSWRNEVWSVKLGQSVPVMSRLRESTPFDQIPWSGIDIGGSHYSDGRPASRHTYWQIQFIDQLNLLVFPGAPAVYGNGNGSFASFDAFDPSINDYLPAGTFTSAGIVPHVSTPTARDQHGNIWQHSGFSSSLVRWSPSASDDGTPGVITNLGTRGTSSGECPYCVDPVRDIMFRAGRSANSTSACWFDLLNSAARTDVTIQGESTDVAAVRLSGSMTYDNQNDCFWYWTRGQTTLRRIDVTGDRGAGFVFTVSQQATTGTVTTATGESDYVGAGYGRFAYAPELKGIVWWHRENQPVRFLRTGM